MYINSPGGIVTSGPRDLRHFMQYIKSPVSTVCVGMAASMGSFLLCAGEPGHRIALPNARVMVHQPSGGFSGKASDIERHAEDIIKTKRRLNEIYAQHCGRTYEEVERTLDRDHFMDAEEAKEWGLVDHIYGSRDAADKDKEKQGRQGTFANRLRQAHRRPRRRPSPGAKRRAGGRGAKPSSRLGTSPRPTARTHRIHHERIEARLVRKPLRLARLCLSMFPIPMAGRSDTEIAQIRRKSPYDLSLIAGKPAPSPSATATIGPVGARSLSPTISKTRTAADLVGGASNEKARI